MPAKKTKKTLKFGFIDQTGAWVIEPRFDGAKPFGGGLAPVCEGAKWGYIDRAGAFVLAPQFASAEPFGPTGVGYVGYDPIDRTGRKLPGLERLAGVTNLWSEGLAPAHAPGATDVGYIDDTHTFVIAPRFERGYPFSEGKAWAWERGADGASAIDRTGKVLFSIAGFKQVFGFSDGMARVQTAGRAGWVDATGKLAIDLGGAKGAPPYTGNHPGGDFADGIAPCWKDGAWCVLDRAGATVFSTEFQEITSYVGGHARVRRGESPARWGLVDRAGKVVVEPIYKQCGFLEDGVAIVQVDVVDHGLVDAAGKLIAQGFGGIWAFEKDGLALALRGGKVCWIDRGGAVKGQTDFDQVNPFWSGRAAARLGAKWGVVERGGKTLVEPKYDRVGTPGELTLVNVGGKTDVKTNTFSGGKWGFVDLRGEEKIALTFDQAGRFSDGIAMAAVLT